MFYDLLELCNNKGKDIEYLVVFSAFFGVGITVVQLLSREIRQKDVLRGQYYGCPHLT